MDKRGQITAFIVIGILILFSVGFVIYIASVRPELSIFAQQETELENYIGVCLEQTAQAAVIVAGAQGGYITIPEEISANERAYFSFSVDGEPKIPLWYYRGAYRVPAKGFIEDEISSYVLDTVDDCLRNFGVFKERYVLELLGNVTVETTIATNDVAVKMNYPLQATELQTRAITKINFVQRTLPVKLGRMHDMANDILKAESNSLFFENMTMDLLATAQETFPFTGMEFSCTPKLWQKSDLIYFAQNMISNNIRKTTVSGNQVTLFNAGNSYDRNHYVFDIGKSYRDIIAGFQYPTSARFELHISPNDRQTIRSNVGRPSSIVGAFMCINTWHFTYDIDYPVLTTLQDASAFDGEGFTFNFAFPVTIETNKGTKADYSLKDIEAPDYLYDFCEDQTGPTVDIRVRNEFTYEEVYRADVSYRCVRLGCDLGQTDARSGIYRLQTKLPSTCTNGVIRANKEGYLQGEATYDSSDYAEVFITPVKKFRVNFIKHDSDDFSRTDELLSGQTAIVFVRSLTHPGFERIFTSDSPQELELIDGPDSYELEVIIMEDGERLIGGYVGKWDVNYNEIADKSAITFNLVQKIPIAVTEEQQIQTAEYLFSDASYIQPLRPVFS